MVLPSSPIKVCGKFVQWILSYDRKKNRKTEITIDFIVTMWHYRIFYRIDYRFQLIGTFWYTVAFVVSWVRPWNETCEKWFSIFRFRYPLKSVVCVKQTANQKPGNFAFDEWKKREIVDIEIKQLELWAFNTKDWDYRFSTQRIGIIGIQHKGLGL